MANIVIKQVTNKKGGKNVLHNVMNNSVLLMKYILDHQNKI